MATIKLRDYLASLSSKGSTALNDKITILDSADGSKIKTVLKSDLVDLTFLAAELRDDLKDDFLNTFGDDVISGSIQIDHDGTTNFVANEHIDHTGVTITAGTGLTGGGDISTNRTINVVSANNGIIANADNIELDNTSSVFTTGVTTHITSADLDMAGNKVLFANVYATEGDLPSAATYHGMFAHVHATGKGYYAHGGAWIKLLDESFSASLDNSYASDSQLTAVSSAFDSTINALDGTYASDSQLTAVSSAFDSTINGLTTADVSEDSSNKYYTDVRVKTKLTAEDVVSGSNSDVKTFLGISASDISDVEAFSQSGTYSGLRAQSTTAGDVDLGNVTNESKATMFTDATLTGNSTAPSQSVSDNSTKIATTEFVQARITDIIGNAGSTLDTLGELSASLAEDSGSLSTLTTTVGTKLAKASNLSDLQDAATARGNLGVDASGTVNYVLPTDLDGDDIDIDTTPLTGATVISDLDINITTDTSGRVTDANGSVATRTLTAANLGLGSSDDVVFNTITGSGIEITGVTNYNGLTIKAGGASRPGINFENVNQGQLGGIYGTEANSLGLSTQGGIQYVVRNANGASGDHLFNSYNTTILKLDGGTNESVFAGNVSISGSLNVRGDIMPSAENLYDIGSAAMRWEDMWADQVYGRSVYVDDYIYHNGDANTYIQFQADRQTFVASGSEFIDFKETAQPYITLGNGNDTDTRMQGGAGYIFIQGSDGYIGINDATPSYPFEVNGNTYIGGTLGVAGTTTISKNAAGLQTNLLLANLNDTDGDAAGIAFSMLDNNTFVKGGLYFERTTTQGRGDLVFINNNEVNGNNASLADADARMKITPAGEVRIGNEYTVNANGLSIEKTGNHIFLRATSATAGQYWNFDVTSNNELGILQDNGDGISIKDTGVLQTPNGIVLNSNTVTGNKTSVTLNNYEEGTWTPTITNANGTLVVAGYDGTGSPAGQYTRVGRLVTLFLQFEITDLDGASSGALVIQGMPFNCTLAGGVGGQGVIPTTGKTLNIARYSDTILNSYQADGSFAGAGTHPTSFVIHYNV